MTGDQLNEGEEMTAKKKAESPEGDGPTASETPADGPDEVSETEPPVSVELTHPDGSSTTVLKPSAEYTNLTLSYGWTEV